MSDAVLAQVLETARWGPTGGNRQPVSFVVVRDRKKKEALRDLYLRIWVSYLAAAKEGTVRIGAKTTAAMVTIGWPEKAFPTKLTRRPLSETAFADEYGSSLSGADKIA